MECKDDDGKVVGCDTFPEFVERGLSRRVDVVLDRLDLCQRREPAQFRTVASGDHAGCRERVIQQALIRLTRLNGLAAVQCKITESRTSPIDLGERLAKFTPQVRREQIQLAAAHFQQQVSPSQRCESPTHSRHALDQ